MSTQKVNRRQRIRHRIRKIISGTAQKPRMSVFRSNTDIYVQLIDDINGKTLISGSSKEKDINSQKITKTEKSKLVGKMVAEKAVAAGITEIQFDRGGYLYHGRVKALAEGAREAGLKF